MKNWMNGLLDKWIIGDTQNCVLNSFIQQSSNPIFQPLR
jgi:hypothetical protein